MERIPVRDIHPHDQRVGLRGFVRRDADEHRPAHLEGRYTHDVVTSTSGRVLPIVSTWLKELDAAYDVSMNRSSRDGAEKRISEPFAAGLNASSAGR